VTIRIHGGSSRVTYRKSLAIRLSVCDIERPGIPREVSALMDDRTRLRIGSGDIGKDILVAQIDVPEFVWKDVREDITALGTRAVKSIRLDVA